MYNFHEYAKPLNSSLCRKSHRVVVYNVAADDGELLINEWVRSLLKEIDGLMSRHFHLDFLFAECVMSIHTTH